MYETFLSVLHCSQWLWTVCTSGSGYQLLVTTTSQLWQYCDINILRNVTCVCDIPVDVTSQCFHSFLAQTVCKQIFRHRNHPQNPTHISLFLLLSIYLCVLFMSVCESLPLCIFLSFYSFKSLCHLFLCFFFHQLRVHSFIFSHQNSRRSSLSIYANSFTHQSVFSLFFRFKSHPWLEPSQKSKHLSTSLSSLLNL